MAMQKILEGKTVTLLPLLKSLSFLVAILLLIYLCMHLYKRKVLSSAPSQRIKILERRALDQKTTIALVCIDDAEMVIVSGANGVAIHATKSSPIVAPRLDRGVHEDGASMAHTVKPRGDDDAWARKYDV